MFAKLHDQVTPAASQFGREHSKSALTKRAAHQGP